MTKQRDDDYDAMCDRCLRERKRSQLRKVKGEKVTILVCKYGCEFRYS